MSEIKRILVVIAGGVGDCIYYSYIFRAIKHKYPQSHVTCVVWSQGYPCPYHYNPFIDEIIEIKNFRDKDKFDKIKPLIDIKFDIVYAINHIRELYYLIQLMKFDALFGHYSYDESYRKVVPPGILSHIDNHKARGISYPEFDLDLESLKPEIYYTDRHREKVAEILDSFPGRNETIVIALSSADKERTIPYKTQKAFITELVKEYDFNIIGVDRIKNQKEIKRYATLADAPITLFIDNEQAAPLGINGVAALINEADYFITPISMGIALADCTMTPTLTIMGYRPSIQNLIVQFAHYCPNLLMLVDDLKEVTTERITNAIVNFQDSSKWDLQMQSKRNKKDPMNLIIDHRVKYKHKTTYPK